MADLILIRHSKPQMMPHINSHDWVLSEKGQALSQSLANKLAPYGITRMITSVEPKARETGQLIAERLGISWEQAEGLHEQLRYTVGWMESEEERIEAIRQLFRKPSEVVFGEESANDALARFSKAIRTVRTHYPDDILGIATHGTVMALFLQAFAGLDAFEFWQSMVTPMAVILKDVTNGYSVVQVILEVKE